MRIFLKYGEHCPGETEYAGHEGKKGWIEIDSWSWQCGRNIQTVPGNSCKREASAPRLREIVITRKFDSSSPRLIQQALAGKPTAAEIHVLVGFVGEKEPLLIVKLANAVVARFSCAAGSADLTEQFSLNYTRIEFFYQGYAKDNQPDASRKSSCVYDLARAGLGEP